MKVWAAGLLPTLALLAFLANTTSYARRKPPTGLPTVPALFRRQLLSDPEKVTGEPLYTATEIITNDPEKTTDEALYTATEIITNDPEKITDEPLYTATEIITNDLPTTTPTETNIHILTTIPTTTNVPSLTTLPATPPVETSIPAPTSAELLTITTLPSGSTEFVQTTVNGASTGSSCSIPCVPPQPDNCVKTSACDNGVCRYTFLPDGAYCQPSNSTMTATCRQGLCVQRSRCDGIACDLQQIDTTCKTPGVCLSDFGVCRYPNAPDLTPCQRLDTDTSGLCVAGNCLEAPLCLGVVCPRSQCGTGVCNPLTGICVQHSHPDGSYCNDGDPFTVLDTCMDGLCRGTDLCDLITCPVGIPCYNSTAACFRGQCSLTLMDAGTPCDDGRTFTLEDQCTSTGVCMGHNPCEGIRCDSLHQCQIAYCSGGQCVEEPRLDGTPCQDRFGSLTQEDRCQTGFCVGQYLIPTVSIPLPSKRIEYGGGFLLKTKAQGQFLTYRWYIDDVLVPYVSTPFLIYNELATTDMMVRLEVENAQGNVTSSTMVMVDPPSETDNPRPGSVYITTWVDVENLYDAGLWDSLYRACFHTSLSAAFPETQVILIRTESRSGGSEVLFTVRAYFRLVASVGQSNELALASLLVFMTENLFTELNACAPARRDAIGRLRREVEAGEFGPIIVINATDPCADVVCSAASDCVEIGECFFGECTEPLKPDNATCDDGDIGTSGDVCNSGQCVGEFVPVDCEVSAWSEFSLCHLELPYNRTRTRTVIQAAEYDGSACPALVDTEYCNPIFCVLSVFSNWSDCDASYPYLRNRTRSILVEAQFGAPPCPTLLTEIETCAPVDCAVGDWNFVGECSKPCGFGVQQQSREVLQPSALGGLPCPDLNHTVFCNAFGCPVDCELSDWFNVTVCSSACGSPGTLRQERHQAIFAENGGKDCDNNTLYQRTVPCDLGSCPVDCVLDTWQAIGECSTTCGPGFQTEQRTALVNPAHGGKPCDATNRTVPCDLGSCPVDCVLDTWQAIGECSTTCGPGTRSELRVILVNPAHGGQPCNATNRTVPCKLEPCAVDCVLDAWQAVGQCSVPCGTGSQAEQRTVLVDPAYGGQPCDFTSRTVPCTLEECNYSHCRFSAWTAASSCAAECGQAGLRQRTREIVNVNATCPSNSTEETVTCFAAACVGVRSFKLDASVRFLNKTLASWTDDDQLLAVKNLADAINVDSIRVKVVAVREGSVIVDIEISGFSTEVHARDARDIIVSAGVTFDSSLGLVSTTVDPVEEIAGDGDSKSYMTVPIAIAIAAGVLMLAIAMGILLYALKRRGSRRGHSVIQGPGRKVRVSPFEPNTPTDAPVCTTSVERFGP